ncbi:MAG: prephenate dehydrogenase/arogenate dehydrogenase family protein [Clostridiales bacterium]|jgi:prephenate dehydrogenase|nr:prephenate dehydrogenase/arogenate dehydrogenase family protein [Clostridiales bacterium]
MSFNIGIIGLGLIGGSIAKALKKLDGNNRIFSYDQNPDFTNSALAEGVIDIICTDLKTDLYLCEIIFLCTPVNTSIEILPLIKEGMNNTCILTDVGSTKREIEAKITSLGLQTQFVGGHPMAGSENFGYYSSRHDLFNGAYYILIPTPTVSTEKVELIKKIVISFGSTVVTLDSATHDYATATISHLPHIVAAGLVHIVDELHENIPIKQLLAGGFKDTTRIASSSPEMWQQICLNNKDQIQILLTQYITKLQEFSTILEANDAPEIYNYFSKAKTFRDSIL